jgi:uncharacterized protein YjiS (DUF1127 family)
VRQNLRRQTKSLQASCLPPALGSRANVLISRSAAYSAACIAEWCARARSRCELLMLDEHELWDLGLTRSEAENEAGKPFWR